MDLPESSKAPSLTPELSRLELTDKEVLAKTYFDCHEYDRCAHLLSGATGKVSMFLRLYALYIVSYAVV